jgi:uncharacterized protein with ParB-like and HNH nuclease domain
MKNDEPLYLHTLQWLGLLWHFKAISTQIIDDLNRAISLLETAVDEPGNNDAQSIARYLVSTLLTRYERSLSVEDLNKAMSRVECALDGPVEGREYPELLRLHSITLSI